MLTLPDRAGRTPRFSGTWAPTQEKDPKVGTVGDSITIQVTVGRIPRHQKEAEINAVDDAITSEIANAWRSHRCLIPAQLPVPFDRRTDGRRVEPVGFRQTPVLRRCRGEARVGPHGEELCSGCSAEAAFYQLA